MSKPPAKRSDAAKNRDRLVAVATARFAAGDGAVTLDAIAQGAGVGIGTLYRHFPTREALVEAVYRTEVDALADGADDLLRNHSALNALRIWIEKYAAFVVTKRAMLDALRVVWAANEQRMSESRARIRAIVAKFVEAGRADGTVRADVLADDITAGMVGILMATANAADPDQPRRLFALLAEGLRPGR